MKMNKFWQRILSVALAAQVVISTHASAAWGLSMPSGFVNISRDSFDLNMVITLICAFIGVIVYGILIWSLVKYRKAKGAKAASFHTNATIEIIWTIIPILILVAMAIPSLHGIA